MQNLRYVNRLPLTLGLTLMMTTGVQRSLAQEIDPNYLCQKSPLNRCWGHRAIEQPQNQFPEQSQDIVSQVIKVKLNKVSNVSEWVRIERTGNQVKLLHTTIAPSFVAKAISVVAGIPSIFSDSGTARAFDIISGLPPLAYTWYDHATSRILFQPDGCEGAKETAPCVLTGTDTIELPAGTNLSEGNFTVEYTERKLLRTVTFRVPPQKL